jgi:hypothetical protein
MSRTANDARAQQEARAAAEDTLADLELQVAEAEARNAEVRYLMRFV